MMSEEQQSRIKSVLPDAFASAFEKMSWPEAFRSVTLVDHIAEITGKNPHSVGRKIKLWLLRVGFKQLPEDSAIGGRRSKVWYLPEEISKKDAMRVVNTGVRGVGDQGF